MIRQIRLGRMGAEGGSKRNVTGPRLKHALLHTCTPPLPPPKPHIQEVQRMTAITTYDLRVIIFEMTQNYSII